MILLESLINNYYVIGGLVVLFIISIWLMISIKNNNKNKVYKPVDHVIKQTVIDGKILAMFDNILNDKIKFHISQRPDLENMSKEEIDEMIAKFVEDIELTFSSNFFGYVFSIYNEKHFQIMIVQKLMQSIYDRDVKDTDSLNIEGGEIT